VAKGPKKRSSFRFAIIFGVLLCLPRPSQSQSVIAPAQDPLAGSRVFGAKGCSKCHAVNGIGGKVGPDLGRIQANRSFNDLAAAMWNHLPAMATSIKEQRQPFPRLGAIETGDLIAFLFTQNYFEGLGKLDSGKKLFNKKSCIQCHQVGGVGGVLGPSLDAVGQSGAPMNVAAAMWNHGPAMAEAMRARGIERPNLSASELRDLVAYLRATAPAGAGAPVSILPGRVNEGRALFEKKQCIKCHSIQGKGGNIGPDLGRRGLYRNLVEFAAALWNKAPAMLRAMKLRKFTVPQLNGEEMADIVAYLRSFQYFGEPGNPDLGRRLLWEKHCLNCHSLDGRGGKGALDLASAKGLASAAAVIAALWSHGDWMAESSPERSLSWPQLKSDEVAHLMAFFERSTRSER
jgi:mono/diheme cytochrome c family protein